MDGARTLEALADAITDCAKLLDQLQVLSRGRQPWQRTLQAHLEDATSMMQVLRMAIAMDRPLPEQKAAAVELCDRLQLAATRLMGTRADPVVRATLKLATELAERIRLGLTDAA
jgi:phage gp36-like protein